MLAELAALTALPAKVAGIDGSQVEAMFVAGKLEELAAYCDSDIFVTYFLFLRFSLITGTLSLEAYDSSLANVQQHLTDRIEKRPHLQAYLTALETMTNSVEQRKRSF